VARHLLTRDDELRRASPWPALLESRTRSELPLAAIQDRLTPDARPLAPEHVVTLAESIVRLGLITPITVDGAAAPDRRWPSSCRPRLLALSGEAREQAFAAPGRGLRPPVRASALGCAAIAALLRTRLRPCRCGRAWFRST
jgi:hypothetical protein